MKLEKFIGWLAVNPYLVLLILFRDLAEVVYWVIVNVFPPILQRLPSLPAMPHIDWIDLVAKVLLCALIIVLQRLVKQTSANQEAWKKEAAGFMIELHRFQAIATRAGIYRHMFNKGLQMRTMDFIKEGEQVLAMEYGQTKKWVLLNKYCKDEVEAVKVLNEFYGMDMTALVKRVEEAKAAGVASPPTTPPRPPGEQQ